MKPNQTTLKSKSNWNFRNNLVGFGHFFWFLGIVHIPKQDVDNSKGNALQWEKEREKGKKKTNDIELPEMTQGLNKESVCLISGSHPICHIW